MSAPDDSPQTPEGPADPIAFCCPECGSQTPWADIRARLDRRAERWRHSRHSTPEAPRAVDVLTSFWQHGTEPVVSLIGNLSQPMLDHLEAAVPGAGPLVILEDGTMTRAEGLDAPGMADDIRTAASAIRGSSWPMDMAQRMEDRANRLVAFADLLRGWRRHDL